LKAQNLSDDWEEWLDEKSVVHKCESCHGPPLHARSNENPHTESRNLLAVLDQLNTDTLSDSRVGLLGLNTDLLEDDALGVRRTTEGGRLESGTESALLVAEIRPLLLLAVQAQLAGGVESSWLSLSCLHVSISMTIRSTS
jgi:hypothetical protein